MSKLLGLYSVTTSRVSCRDWALAGDQTAGAGNALAVAAAEIDFRKSRRFIAHPRGIRHPLGVWRSKACAIAPRVVPRPTEASEIPAKFWLEAASENRQRATRAAWLPDL